MSQVTNPVSRVDSVKRWLFRRRKSLRPILRDRPFTVLDSMILIAALAVAFVSIKPVLETSRPGRWSLQSGTLAMVSASVVVLTPTVLFLKLRSPRPKRFLLVRQPDFVAVVAATMMLSICALAFVVVTAIRTVRQDTANYSTFLPYWQNQLWWVQLLRYFAGTVGPAVLSCWVVLVISGIKRPSKGWLNLLGQSLGVIWVILFIIHTCVMLRALCVPNGPSALESMGY